MPQLSLGQYILAGLVATVGLASVIMSDFIGEKADMLIEPNQGTTVIGETISVKVMVESNTPVNVFGGEVRFDPEILTVDSIDYNTSIADLWAVKPWYENGAGTINFVGGTTKPGGFTGKDSLITVNFQTLKTGETKLGIKGAKIMQHDGLGTEANLAEPIDAVYLIKEDNEITKTITGKDIKGSNLKVLPQLPDTDLNGDGEQTVADVSIFMTHLISKNKRSDFNNDGKVNTADLSILMSTQ